MDVRVGEDVVGSEREGEAGGDGAGADHGLGVFDEARDGFVERGEVGREEGLEDAGAAAALRFFIIRISSLHSLDLRAPFAVPAVRNREIWQEAIYEPVRKGQHQGEQPRELL